MRFSIILIADYLSVKSIMTRINIKIPRHLSFSPSLLVCGSRTCLAIPHTAAGASAGNGNTVACPFTPRDGPVSTASVSESGGGLLHNVSCHGSAVVRGEFFIFFRKRKHRETPGFIWISHTSTFKDSLSLCAALVWLHRHKKGLHSHKRSYTVTRGAGPAPD